MMVVIAKGILIAIKARKGISSGILDDKT